MDKSPTNEAAAPAALRYSNATEPGLRRLAHGKSFRYVDAERKPVRDRATLARIRALAIPPAWVDVWICADAGGHLQAVGRDARGRRQYRYHADWTAHRAETKYARLRAWVERLAKLRATVARDVGGKRSLDRDRVVATVVALLDTTCMRVGNSEYANTNGSFGITTLRDRHASVSAKRVRLRFRGKSGVLHDVAVDDPQLARIVRRCQDLPGQQLFQYVDDAGAQHPVSSQDVNAYIRAVTGEEFSAKDLRTWRGTVAAAEALAAMPPAATVAARKRQANEAAAAAAAILGNTAAVCRRCYIHPAVFDAHERDAVAAAFAPPLARRRWLDRAEVAVLRLLRRRPPVHAARVASRSLHARARRRVAAKAARRA